MNSILQNFLFVLKRFRTSSVLVILGLSIAMAVFTVSFLQAEYDLSYDRGFKKHKDIYLLNMKMGTMSIDFPVTFAFLADNMARDFGELKNHCLTSQLIGQPKREFRLLNDASDDKKYEMDYVTTTSGFFDVFTPQIIAGDVTGIFEEAGRAMISEGWAKTLFGNESAIGRILIKEGDDSQLVITAVYKDFSKRSTLINGVYTQIPEKERASDHYSINTMAFFEIEKPNVEPLMEKVNNGDWLSENSFGGMITGFSLTSFTDIHYLFSHYQSNDGGSQNATLSLLAIGIVILIIAYINFINFAIALSPARVRELNIRKILGESDLKLRFVLAFEAALFSFCSYVLSLLILHFINDSFIRDFLSIDLGLMANLKTLILLAASVTLAGFLIGIYPAFYTTKFQPATVLNGKFALSGKGAGLRNVLITIQFFASITLIIVSIQIKMQHDFMHRESWKFERDNIVYVPTSKDMQYEAFMAELKTNPNITDYTYSAALPGGGGASYYAEGGEGNSVTIAGWYVAPNFLDFFGIPVKEGEGFSDDESRQSILNQKAKDAFESENIIGETLFKQAKVCGIIEDISFLPLSMKIDPMAF